MAFLYILCTALLTGLLTGCETSKGKDLKLKVELGVLVIVFSALKDDVVLQL